MMMMTLRDLLERTKASEDMNFWLVSRRGSDVSWDQTWAAQNGCIVKALYITPTAMVTDWPPSQN
jgi:hypothetical protein